MQRVFLPARVPILQVDVCEGVCQVHTYVYLPTCCPLVSPYCKWMCVKGYVKCILTYICPLVSPYCKWGYVKVSYSKWVCVKGHVPIFQVGVHIFVHSCPLIARRCVCDLTHDCVYVCIFIHSVCMYVRSYWRKVTLVSLCLREVKTTSVECCW